MTNNAKCLMPWIHTYVETNGSVSPCCLYDGSVGNTHTDSIETIWNNNEFKKIRQTMLDGELPRGCKECINKEKAGIESKRLREARFRSHQLDLIQDAKPMFQPRYIDIRYNNICNFQCRMCGPKSSHKISAEYKNLGLISTDNHIIRINYENSVAPIINNSQLIDEIYFAGGEPLIMQEHYDFLDALIDQNKTDLHIRYSTNLSVLQYKKYNLLDYWNKFDKVSLHASIDGTHNKLEYMRYGSNWENTIKNLKNIKLLPNVEIFISITISVFNVLDIIKIIKTFIELEVIDLNNVVLGNLVYEPDIYSIQTLHPRLKTIAKERITNYLEHNNLPVNLKQSLEYIITFMYANNTYEETNEKFISKIKLFDKSRNENFVDTFPELQLQYIGKEQ